MTLPLTLSTAALPNMFAEKSVFLREALQAAVGVDLVIKVAVSGTVAPPEAETPARPPQPVAEDVDLTDSVDEPDVEPVHDPVALLQNNLGAQIIGEVDSS